jgi:Family of unknown function (DUF6339)
MKIKFISQEGLATLKSNLSHVASRFADPTPLWIEDSLGTKTFLYSKFETNDFALDMSQEDPFLTEFENVKRVYSAMNMISDSQASDERIWAGMCLTDFWNYVQYRWRINENSSVNIIKQHFFFGFGARRSLTRNALSRLWWIGRLTYDDTREDPYELTKFVCRNSDYIMHILERNTSNNKNLIRGFLDGVCVAAKEGLNINTNTVAELSRYLNLLGGTYVLDCLPKETLSEKILLRAREICI